VAAADTALTVVRIKATVPLAASTGKVGCRWSRLGAPAQTEGADANNKKRVPGVVVNSGPELHLLHKAAD
jgi:hypothetical protein